MRTLALALFLTCGALNAQTVLLPLDLASAGAHLEKAGKQRNVALSIALGGTLLAAGAIISAEGDADAMRPGIALGATCALISVGLNFSANSHERKAGKYLHEL